MDPNLFSKIMPQFLPLAASPMTPPCTSETQTTTPSIQNQSLISPEDNKET